MLEFLATSDIHHDDYKNGITLADTIAVEDEITQYAINHSINLVIFAGDLYRSTNPLHHVINAAEAAWKRRSDVGIVTFAMPGNHDYFTKSITSGHAFASVNIFSTDLKNVTVVDKVQILNVQGINFLFVPAGHVTTLPQPTNAAPTVIVFHDLIAGSYLSGGRPADDGIDVSEINKVGAILVLGGDNHIPQSLSKIIPSGFYLGAPLQHNWGDRDQNRGFWHIKITTDGKPIVHSTLIPTNSPKFIRITMPACTTDVETIMALQHKLNEYTNRSAIIEVTLIGDKTININQEVVKNAILELGHRSVRIILSQVMTKIELIPQSISQPEDKWNYFVTNTTNVDLDINLLSKIGTWAISEARKII